MRPYRRSKVCFVFFAVVGCASIGLAGCSSADSSPTEEAQDEGALRTGPTLLSGVARIERSHSRPGETGRRERTTDVVAAKAKVKRLLAGIKEARRHVACGMRAGNGDVYYFYDATSKEIGTAHLACGQGTLTQGSETTRIAIDGSVAEEVFGAELVPADVLYDLEKIELSFRGETKVATDTADKRAVLETMKVEATKDGGPLERCAPDHSMSFYRGGEQVATAFYRCSGRLSRSQVAHVTHLVDDDYPRLGRGGMELDGIALDALFDRLPAE